MYKKLFSLSFIIILALIGGCSFHQQKLPKETPEKVVDRFFKLLAEGGPSSLAEARKMVSDKYFFPTEYQFKTWVEAYPANSEIKNLKSNILSKSGKDVIVQVTLEYAVPSEFGGSFTSTSKMNLILDDKTNSWKIDFTAETLPEESYKNEKGG